MELPSGAFVMAGATIAGIITAVVTLVSMLISKEQKVTEYRELRRQRIREEAAQYLAEIDTLFKLYQAKLTANSRSKLSESELDEFRCKHKANMYRLFEMRHRLFLRLTPERSTELKEALVKIEEIFFSQSICEDTLHQQRDNIIKEIQSILKYEWERVKAGEPDYQKAERNSKLAIKSLLIVLFITVMVALHLFFESEEIEPKVAVPKPGLEQHLEVEDNE